MIGATVLSGIWAATLTPIDQDGVPDAARAAAYYMELLQGGCDGVNVLGTTGEAMSLDVRTRVDFMEGILRHGVPPARTMFGTGACALADAAALTQTASELGAAAALVMPPFFYRNASDDGILAWFDALFARVDSPPPVLLYNFPRMSGITFHVALVDRLCAAFPGAIAGMKDSSNDARLQREILARHPSLRVFTASEEYIVASQAYGAAGCISGSVCLWPQEAANVYRTGDERAQALLAERRRALAQRRLIDGVRERVARKRGDDSWLRAIPPL